MRLMGSVRMKLGLTHPPLKRYQIATPKPILVILFLKCSLECGRLHFNLYEVIRLPQQPLYPDSGKLTLNCIILNTESPLWSNIFKFRLRGAQPYANIQMSVQNMFKS